jgi:hypothetical protein
MGGGSDSGRPERRRVDTAAKAAFLAAIRDGAPRDEAAERAGFTSEAFYYQRKRDPVFRLAWIFARDLSAADERSAAATATLTYEAGQVRIVPNANRILQRRPVRRRIFDERRKRLFLDHFAGTADLEESAAVAGVAKSTVVQHRLKDPDFAAACEAALAIGYALLEGEAVRQRLEAQQKLREGLCPTGEIAQEFERVMRLLARYERKGGRIGFREVAAGQERRWTFDEAIDWLDRKLQALGVRRGIIPPSAADDLE